MASSFITPGKVVLSGVVLIGLLFACLLVSLVDDDVWLPPGKEMSSFDESGAQDEHGVTSTVTQFAIQPAQSPTPDAPHPLPTLRTEAEQYTVQPNDSLGQIAQWYHVSVDMILAENNIPNPNILEIGLVLTIPPPKPIGDGPAFKIIPDSELVYSPSNADFHLAGFVHEKGGYLSGYKGEIDDREMSGVRIVERVAQDFSINPRLLLAILEYQSGWVTSPDPGSSTMDYPIGLPVEWRQGLYHQLAWAADYLNRGYYLWRVNGLATWTLGDGKIVRISPTINAGTAGVQHLFSQLLELDDWERAVSNQGLFSTYNDLFGSPFQFSVEPILPPNLTQPELQLPFEEGVTWAFTGGPHGGWGSGAAWAAIDFAPPGEALGCVESDDWVVAVADGLILRSANGAVVQGLDQDGLEQTGWSVLYMHIERRDRVRSGTFLQAGDRIGHPSCEGGVSSGTHVHLARRYNGEWIPADQDIPFILDGWTTEGLGREYDGFLVKDGMRIEAWEGHRPENEIER